MKATTPSPERLEQLISLCLEVYEEHGPDAVDEVLVENAPFADAVRERLDLLGRLGLIGETPAGSRPERIGDYRIRDVLGRGGMGVVYEADQDSPARRVALKVLRNFPGNDALGRFHHEADLLARLQHPGIAQIYELGTATVGGMTVPFIAMELVRGEPVDRYAESEQLDTRARLTLIADIADAVHHAHQKGVIHRDLKPANILVDERGEPRIFDFGIARTIDPDLELSTMRTEIGQLIGTLAYMSPEQAAGEPGEIDTRADVYSLGVVGYQLLAGRLPHVLESRSVIEGLRAIRDDDPPRLGALDRALRGDIETIIEKALAKEKVRRYASAYELAADIRRHLANEPISARPATATYQISKFVRRHRSIVAGAAAVLVALVLGLVGTWHGLVEANEQSADSERRFNQASAVLEFQGSMFASADPARTGLQVVELLDGAAQRIPASFADPVHEAAIRQMLGEAYAGIGAWEAALPLLERALEIFEAQLGADDLASLTTRARVAGILCQALGRFEEAAAAIDGVIARASAAHGPTHPVVLEAKLVLCGLMNERGDNREADELSKELAFQATVGDPLWVDAMSERALALDALGEFELAEKIAREALDGHLATHGEEDLRTLETLETLGIVLQNGGQVEAGGEVVLRTLALRRRLLGDEHPATVRTMANAQHVFTMRGDFERAEELLREALEICDREFSDTDPIRMLVANNLGALLVSQQRYGEATEIFIEVLELVTEGKGPEHADTVATLGNLAHAYQGQGQFGEAEVLLSDVLEITRRTKGDRHPDTAMACGNLAGLFWQTKQCDLGEPLAYEAVEIARETLRADDYLFSYHLFTLGRILICLGRPAEAEEALLEGKASLEQALTGDHPLKGAIDATIRKARADLAAE